MINLPFNKTLDLKEIKLCNSESLNNIKILQLDENVLGKTLQNNVVSMPIHFPVFQKKVETSRELEALQNFILFY